MGQSLKIIRKFPHRVELHFEYFKQAERDDVWLAQVGKWGWTVIGQDYKHHIVPAELDAIERHSVGAFYLWGSNAPMWDTYKVLVKSVDKMAALSDSTPRPFVFKVLESGRIVPVKLPRGGPRA